MRTVPAPDDRPPEQREIRGKPEAIAGDLRAFAELGIDHLQVQLRPNSLAGVEAFTPILDRLGNGATKIEPFRPLEHPYM